MSDPDDKIKELEKILGEKEKKIEELKQQLEQLKREGDRSKRRIKELESLKKQLTDEKKQLKKELMNATIDEKIKAATDPLKKELKKKDDDIQLLRNDVKNYVNKSNTTEKKCNVMQKDLDVYKDKTKKLEESRDLLYVGQLCMNFMEAIYRDVLPGYFERTNYPPPHVKYMEKDINEFCHSDEEKGEAKRKWKSWKEMFGPDTDVVALMEKFLEKRKVVAHPKPLYSKQLEKIADSLIDDKDRADVKNLIKITDKMGLLEHQILGLSYYVS